MTLFINELKNEFIELNEEITVPQISVKEISISQKYDFDKLLRNILPGYVSGHDLLLSPVPKSDTHFVHYVKKIEGKNFDFLHVLKFDMRFSGDSLKIIEKGSPDFYPSYRTERLLFKSYVIPVKRVIYEKRVITGFDSEYLVSKMKVDSDQYFHTFAMFDEFDKTELIEKFNEIIGTENLPVLFRIYSFWDFNNFTFSLNIPNPTLKNIEDSIEIFEPAWIMIKSRMDKEFLKNIPDDKISEYRELYRNFLIFNDLGVFFTEKYFSILRKYLSCYSFYTDDDLAVKRWRRIEIPE